MGGLLFHGGEPIYTDSAFWPVILGIFGAVVVMIFAMLIWLPTGRIIEGRGKGKKSLSYIRANIDEYTGYKILPPRLKDALRYPSAALMEVQWSDGQVSKAVVDFSVKHNMAQLPGCDKELVNGH